MKYLTAYLEAANSADVRNDQPTEPTKPHGGGGVGSSGDFEGYRGQGAYETYKTPDEPPQPIFGRSDWAYLSTLRWGPALGDPEPGIDIDPPF